MLSWNEIDTVLLDMDGTLLDLHFDNHFWLEVVPAKLASIRGISRQQADAFMAVEFERVAGTLQWYCLDYWSTVLQLDIMQAKREIQHLIAIRDDALPFLDALKHSGRDIALVTNAHPDSLSLKIERTALNRHIDTLISTHEFGVSKESQQLWQQLQQRLQFDPSRTLFVDDSVAILEAAQQFGISHLLAVSNPDSQRPSRDIQHFPAIQDFRYLLDDIQRAPVATSSQSCSYSR